MVEAQAMRRPLIAMLADGRRLHMQDGPIDLIVEAFGAAEEAASAYGAATGRFHGLLDELCGELQELRSPVRPGSCFLAGPVARRMHEAVLPFAGATFITPMAAVAGAVAEEILGHMLAAAKLRKAYVNNGGDIALYLAPGESFAIGLIDRPDAPSLFATATIRAKDGIGGIATSGWRGRSFSLGIADAVTVLAGTAAAADAAATIIANAVDLPGHSNIIRRPASSLQPDSDLRELPVTCAVAPLSSAEIGQALDAGARRARQLAESGQIAAAAMHLQGTTRTVGALQPPPFPAFAFEMQDACHA
ncbi:MAG: UPF0280 family protein [Hyphomicrobiales bacterium]